MPELGRPLKARGSEDPPLRGGEAGEEEAEESVGVGAETDLGVGRAGGIGWAGVGARKTLFVDADVHGLDGAEGGVDEEGALDLVELELGGVEGHDEEGDFGGEEFLGGGNVIEDVPFGLRGLWRAEAEVAVAAVNRATHENDALEFAEGGGVLVDGGANVHQGADGD